MDIWETVRRSVTYNVTAGVMWINRDQERFYKLESISIGKPLLVIGQYVIAEGQPLWLFRDVMTGDRLGTSYYVELSHTNIAKYIVHPNHD